MDNNKKYWIAEYRHYYGNSRPSAVTEPYKSKYEHYSAVSSKEEAELVFKMGLVDHLNNLVMFASNQVSPTLRKRLKKYGLDKYAYFYQEYERILSALTKLQYDIAQNIKNDGLER